MHKSSPADYVVVGGGSAGCVLANRLSADPDVRVTLIEAGGWDRNILIRMPAGFLGLMRTGIVNWRYSSEPQPSLGGRVLYAPRGKVLGGSSSINGMVYARGDPPTTIAGRSWATEAGPTTTACRCFRRPSDTTALPPRGAAPTARFAPCATACIIRWPRRSWRLACSTACPTTMTSTWVTNWASARSTARSPTASVGAWRAPIYTPSGSVPT